MLIFARTALISNRIRIDLNILDNYCIRGNVPLIFEVELVTIPKSLKLLGKLLKIVVF